MDSRIHIDVMNRMNSGEMDLITVIDYIQEQYGLTKEEAQKYALFAEELFMGNDC